MPDPVEAYLRDLSLIRASGAAVPETSYYGPLANLLNEIGGTLKPKVRCVVNIRNRGAGLPDVGLFAASQFQKASAAETLPGQMPERGVIEVKPTPDDAWITADGEQVSKYWGKYRQVLVTNYRDFVLVGQDPEGNAAKLETFRLAQTEAAFWAEAAHPRAMADKLGERLVEYLKRVMLHPAPLADPKDVAWFLASYARDARARIEHADLPALAAVRTALEEALGLKFEGEKGEHFFRSTLVQTLFYGVFSAWVLWDKTHSRTDRTARFNWHEAEWSLHVPMIRALYEQLATPTQLRPLGLVEALDWTGAVLNRVDRAAFFERFEEGHAVQYFYEPFLQAFDPELRKELGVWYTPPEIIKYMVARVDAVLRSELDLPDGLADPRVYVLDPCCGTGAYLVEVLQRIHATLQDKGGDALAAQDVKKAALERVFGFEILPAPFVISHLQLGLFLQNLGAPLSDERSERAGVYLTNALTGWEPPTEESKKQLRFLEASFPELKQEHDAAERVKRETPILVVLGNPPYNGFAGAPIAEERDLSNAYRTTKRAPAPQGQGLNDLYVRFYRMAERRIVEGTGKGVVCLISNYSWLDGLSFTGMRERYLEEFDGIWIDCLNGDKFKTGKLTPDGQPDPSVFSTEFSREGIQVGTAVALLVRRAAHEGGGFVRFRDLWGRTKRAELLETAVQDGVSLYQAIHPALPLGLPFMPLRTEAGYLTWPLLADILPVVSPGVNTSPDLDLVDIDLPRLKRRMGAYFDASLSDDAASRVAPALMTSKRGYDAGETRRYLLQRGIGSGFFVRFAYRPFDARNLYWHPETALLDRNRADLFAAARGGNMFLTSRQKAERAYEGTAFYVTPNLADRHLTRPGSQCFPLTTFVAGMPTANLSPAARAYLAALGIADPDAEASGCHSERSEESRTRDSSPAAQNDRRRVQGDRPENGRDGRATLDSRGGCPTYASIWMHALAIGYSPAYLAENADGIRQDWPRIPLPNTKDALLASAALGCQVAALLDTENDVPGVTTGAIRPELKTIAVISREGAGALNPDAGDLDVTAGWGHAGKGGVVMPGKGRLVARAYTPQEIAGFGGTGYQPVHERLGATTFDIYLNDVAYWKNIPAQVWRYTIGGYQVIKKWLSYRERDLLGRSLTPEEVREVMNIARRIAAILLLEPALDANYQAAKADAFPWKA